MRRWLCAVVTVLTFLNTQAHSQVNRPPAPPLEIAFTVGMQRPHTHLFEIDIKIKRSATGPSEELLIMPVWTPGSYLIREFERQVQDFSAKDAAGQSLKWEKTNKNTWKVMTNGAAEWHASYRVYANELTVRSSELNSEHAFWNNANLLMYLDGALKNSSTVQVLAPDAWKVATGLPITPGPKNTFRAENFDVLYDSPFEASNFKTIVFNVKGVPHRIVIDGEGNYDAEKMRRDVQKIVETEVEIMGGEILTRTTRLSFIFDRMRAVDSNIQIRQPLVIHALDSKWNEERGPHRLVLTPLSKRFAIIEGSWHWYLMNFFISGT